MLKDIPLFSCLEDHEIEHLEKVALKKLYLKNRVVVSEGDESDCLYVIESGKVKAIINDEEGKEITLNMHGPGEYFGELSLIDGEPRSATIMTKERTKFVVIMRDNFKKMLLSNSEMSFNFLKGLTKLLRQTTHKVENFAFLDVYGRIRKVLHDLAKPQGDKFIIEEKLTHQEIANFISSSREMVSKILKELSDGGYISIDKKQITIHKRLPRSY